MQPKPANDNTPRPSWFDALLLQYSPFLRKRCQNEETYQEVVCRAMEQWQRFRPNGNFPTWLSFIVRTVRHEATVRDSRNSTIPRQKLVQDPVQEFLVEADSATRKLSPANVTMVSMLAKGCSFVEVAAEQHVSPQAVRERAGRVWRAMRAVNDNRRANAA